MTRSNRLLPLVENANERIEESARAVAAAREVLARQEARLAELMNYRQQYEHSAAAAQSTRFFSVANSRAFQAQLDEAAVHTAAAIALAEVRRTDGRGVTQVFLDGEVVVERVVLRDECDEAFELFEVVVKLLAIEQDLPARGRKPARNGTEQRAFSRAAAAHHAHDVAAVECEAD